MSTQPTWPSAIRQRILDDHAWLREEFDAMDAISASLRAGEEPPLARERIQALVQRVEEHLRLEDQILDPALREVDAFGDVWAAHLATHHTNQRLILADLAALAAVQGTSQRLGEALAAIVAELRDDMRTEEKDLLRPDLLRDDLIAINHQGA
jgi:hypothetical protein